MTKKWYAISVFSNFENKVAEQIRAAVDRAGMKDQIESVVVPVEQVFEIRRGKQISREQRFLPGYILIKMEMTDQAFYLVNSINRVAGFLGPPGQPTPLSEDEVQEVLSRADAGKTKPRVLIHFQVGDEVMVTDGPFEGWNGMVEEVDADNSRVVIGVSIFGRVTQTELGFDQVSKSG